jgi:hypothetical protein
VIKASSHGAARKHIRRISGNRNDYDFLASRLALDLLGHLEAVHTGKTDIQEEEIRPTDPDHSQNLAAVKDGLRVATGEAQEECQRRCQIPMSDEGLGIGDYKVSDQRDWRGPATRECSRPTSIPWGNDAKTVRPCLARANGAGPMLFILREPPGSRGMLVSGHGRRPG